MSTNASKPSRRLILLADGGALAELNERLEVENVAKKDFARVPEVVLAAAHAAEVQATSDKIDRLFCNVGSAKAAGFVQAIGEVWTVRTFPLTVAKYDRAVEKDERHRFRLRFHAYMGYALGLIVGGRREDTPAQAPLVAVMTDDPHLLPCMSHARSHGLDTRLVWWQSAFSADVAYLASRNNVPTMLLPDEDAFGFQPMKSDSALDGIMRRAGK